ncbi:MAG: type VII toxin-antitoxin system HepT family RNase toxin [Candidatus Asgardarchaeia archaeon]
MINKLKLPKPSTYSDIFRILCEHDVLPRDMVDILVDMARFRNVLVHGYVRIDKKRVYEILIENLEVIRNVAEKIISKIDKLEKEK